VQQPDGRRRSQAYAPRRREAFARHGSAMTCGGLPDNAATLAVTDNRRAGLL
jgi:hypothetical protein